jgi:tetratricopeptide (TPR) repeat protein
MAVKQLVFRCCVALLATVAGGLPVLVWAEAPPSAAASPAEVVGEQGREAFRAGRFADALRLFEQAFAADGAPRWLYNMAKCKEKLADYPAAVRLLERYLESYRDKNAGQDPPDAADARRLAGDLKRRAYEGLPEVSIQSTPPGAQVLLANGSTLGSTPLTTHLEAGRYRLRFKLEGYSDEEAELEVGQSGKFHLAVPLKSMPEVYIQSVPPGAQVLLANGATVGSTPLKLRLRAGRYQLRVRLLGFADEEPELQISQGSSVNLVVNLKSLRKQAALAVWSNIRGAQVTLDGKVVAVTPFAGQLPVEPGRHQVLLTRQGFASVEQLVDVPEDKLATVRAVMRLESSRLSWRGGLGWPAFLLGLGGVATGGVYSWLADREYRDSPPFLFYERIQNLGYRAGGALAGAGLALLIWDATRDNLRDDERMDGPLLDAGVTLQPLGANPPGSGAKEVP